MSSGEMFSDVMAGKKNTAVAVAEEFLIPLFQERLLRPAEQIAAGILAERLPQGVLSDAFEWGEDELQMSLIGAEHGNDDAELVEAQDRLACFQRVKTITLEAAS